MRRTAPQTTPEHSQPLLALLDGPPDYVFGGTGATENMIFKGLADDSRKVRTGDLFIARQPGFVVQAVEAGAAAVVIANEHAQGAKEALKGVAEASSAPIFVVDTVDQHLAGRMAERFHHHPARSLKLVGITGTNGKTTTAFIAQHLIQTLCGSGLNSGNHENPGSNPSGSSGGGGCGMIGTVFNHCPPDPPSPADLTTPGAIELSGQLAKMRDNGCTTCVLETSSHALDQGRVGHLNFTAAVFTNLTQDHLDYHQDMATYAAAKKRLFESLRPGAAAIVNADDPTSLKMLDSCAGTAILTSLRQDRANEPGTCLALGIELFANRSTALFLGPWGQADITLPMTGRHNLSNALQAAAATFAITPFTGQALADALAQTPPVPGRLEPVPNAHFALPTEKGSQSTQTDPLPAVLVDYAHTPDAVVRALTSLRPVTPGKLVVVLGCGGDRDKTKRPLMAQAALKHADRAIFTSDNPRKEPAESILDDMIAGLDASTRAGITVEPDRRAAIQLAIHEAALDDTVLLAGKGHEDYQIIGEQKIHFDDREQAVAALATRATTRAKR